MVSKTIEYGIGLGIINKDTTLEPNIPPLKRLINEKASNIDAF